MIDVLAGICLVTGSALALLAGIGLIRFPEVLMRMHAATKPQTLGLLLVLLGIALRLQSVGVAVTLGLVAVFQLVTAPVSAHIVGRAAFRNGFVDRDRLVVDELTDDTA